MNSLEELLKRRLQSAASKKADIGGHNIDTVSIANQEPESSTALLVDKWGMRRGEQLADKKREALLMADCNASMFEVRPTLAANPTCKHRAKWFNELLQSDAYKATHATTACDKGASAIAAMAIADEYLRYLSENPADESTDDIRSDIARNRSVSHALATAESNAKMAIDAAHAMGAGSRDESFNNPIDPTVLAKCFESVQDNIDLQAIFDVAGRYRRYARALQASKAKHGYDDMVGVKVDGEIAHLVASELSKLACEELELDLLRRIVERQAFCREYEGYEKKAQGPIVVVVDESGSMSSNNRIINAKGIALTMAWIARQQNRWCAFVTFTNRKHGRTLVMPPGKWDQGALINWMIEFENGGGTSLRLLMDTLPNQYWAEFGCPKGKTDIIVITDGHVPVEYKFSDSFAKWKVDNSVKCYSIILDRRPGGLASVSDRYWCMQDLDMGNDGIKEIFSI